MNYTKAVVEKGFYETVGNVTVLSDSEVISSVLHPIMENITSPDMVADVVSNFAFELIIILSVFVAIFLLFFLRKKLFNGLF